jgi:protein phosphatase 1L
VPPTNFADYEPAGEGSGWYLYKRTGKWKYHPETGLYLHVKSDVYYVQKNGDAKSFRRIDDEDDHVVRKMKQAEEMRKAIQATEFVAFEVPKAGASSSIDEAEAAAAATSSGASASRAGAADGQGAVGPAVAPQQQASAPQQLDDVDGIVYGKVREWNVVKGFGFIVPEAKGKEQESIFVHLRNVVGYSQSTPINLKEGARVQYSMGEQDGKPRAMDVAMLDASGKPLPVHAGVQSLETKRKGYYVTSSVLGVRVHCESWPGKQQDLTDRFTQDIAMEELGVYFGCFDGHYGAQVAELAAKQLHKNLMQIYRQKQVQPASRDEKIKASIKDAFLQTDKEILGLAERKKFGQSGSTALVAMLHGNPKLGTALRLVVAHVGDSRAVLCRGGEAICLTEDHKPDRIDEKKRVERAGGLVLNVRGAWRVAAPANPKSNAKNARREYQGMSCTRSLGDIGFKAPSALSVAEPDVKVMTPTDKDLFVVLCTANVYSVCSNQEVVDLASAHWDDPEAASKHIVRTAFNKGADGNLTAMVIQFGWADNHVKSSLERRRVIRAQAADESEAPRVRKSSQPAPVIKAVENDGFDMFG